MNKPKNKTKSRTLITVLTLVALVIAIYFIRREYLLLNQHMGFSMIQFILVIIASICLYLFALYISKSVDFKIFEFAVGRFFNVIVWPGMVFALMFLGAIHSLFPYDSLLKENLTISLGIMGSGLYKLFSIGSESPILYFWAFPLFLIISTWFFIDDIIDFKRKSELDNLDEYIKNLEVKDDS